MIVVENNVSFEFQTFPNMTTSPPGMLSACLNMNLTRGDLMLRL